MRGPRHAHPGLRPPQSEMACGLREGLRGDTPVALQWKMPVQRVWGAESQHSETQRLPRLVSTRSVRWNLAEPAEGLLLLSWTMGMHTRTPHHSACPWGAPRGEGRHSEARRCRMAGAQSADGCLSIRGRSRRLC